MTLRRWLLRSPFHGLVSGRLALVTVPGQDKPALVTYRKDGMEVTVLGAGDVDWWQSLSPEGTTAVTVRLAGYDRPGDAAFLAGDELDEAMIAFLHTNPGAWQQLAVAPDASGDELAAAAQQAAVIRITLRR